MSRLSEYDNVRLLKEIQLLSSEILILKDKIEKDSRSLEIIEEKLINQQKMISELKLINKFYLWLFYYVSFLVAVGELLFYFLGIQK